MQHQNSISFNKITSYDYVNRFSSVQSHHGITMITYHKKSFDYFIFIENFCCYFIFLLFRHLITANLASFLFQLFTINQHLLQMFNLNFFFYFFMLSFSLNFTKKKHTHTWKIKITQTKNDIKIKNTKSNNPHEIKEVVCSLINKLSLTFFRFRLEKFSFLFLSVDSLQPKIYFFQYLLFYFSLIYFCN